MHHFFGAWDSQPSFPSDPGFFFLCRLNSRRYLDNVFLLYFFLLSFFRPCCCTWLVYSFLWYTDVQRSNLIPGIKPGIGLTRPDKACYVLEARPNRGGGFAPEIPGLPILRGHAYHSYGLCALSLSLTCNTLPYVWPSLLIDFLLTSCPCKRIYADTVPFFLSGKLYIWCRIS